MKKREFEDVKEQAYYENCIDCLYFGYGSSYAKDTGLSEEKKKEIWNMAFEDMCKDD